MREYAGRPQAVVAGFGFLAPLHRFIEAAAFYLDGLEVVPALGQEVADLVDTDDIAVDINDGAEATGVQVDTADDRDITVDRICTLHRNAGNMLVSTELSDDIVANQGVLIAGEGVLQLLVKRIGIAANTLYQQPAIA